MSKPTRIIDNLGPYCAHPPVRDTCELSKKTFEHFHQARGGPERSGESGKEHLLMADPRGGVRGVIPERQKYDV